jgi:hypothetical protein
LKYRRKAVAPVVAVGDEFARGGLGQPAILHHPPQPDGHWRDKSHVECVWMTAEEATATAADQAHVGARRKLIHELSQDLEIAAMDATGPEPIENSGRVLVDPFHLDFKHTEPNGFLFKECPVVTA